MHKRRNQIDNPDTVQVTETQLSLSNLMQYGKKGGKKRQNQLMRNRYEKTDSEKQISRRGHALWSD
jgi:hypothetical protein